MIGWCGGYRRTINNWQEQKKNRTGKTENVRIDQKYIFSSCVVVVVVVVWRREKRGEDGVERRKEERKKFFIISFLLPPSVLRRPSSSFISFIKMFLIKNALTIPIEMYTRMKRKKDWSNSRRFLFSLNVPLRTTKRKVIVVAVHWLVFWLSAF